MRQPPADCSRTRNSGIHPTPTLGPMEMLEHGLGPGEKCFSKLVVLRVGRQMDFLHGEDARELGI